MKQENIVEYVAGLARVDVSAEEKQVLGQQVSKILGYVEKLNQLNVDDVEPMRALADQNVFRADQPKECVYRQAILDNAPACQDSSIKIPKVIE